MDKLRSEKEYKQDAEYKNILKFINEYPNITMQTETGKEEVFNIGRELDKIEARIILNNILK